MCRLHFFFVVNVAHKGVGCAKGCVKRRRSLSVFPARTGRIAPECGFCHCSHSVSDRTSKAPACLWGLIGRQGCRNESAERLAADGQSENLAAIVEHIRPPMAWPPAPSHDRPARLCAFSVSLSLGTTCWPGRARAALARKGLLFGLVAARLDEQLRPLRVASYLATMVV